MDRTNRCEILKTLATLAIGGAVPSLIPMHGIAENPRLNSGVRLGAQTNAWTIDPLNLDSFLAVLSDIKRIGYAGFETGFSNLSHQFDAPKEARQKIAATDFL